MVLGLKIIRGKNVFPPKYFQSQNRHTSDLEAGRRLPHLVVAPLGQRAPPITMGLGSQFKNNYFTEMCSGSEAGSYLRLIDVVYHSTLGLRVIKKKKYGGRPPTPSKPQTLPPPPIIFNRKTIVIGGGTLTTWRHTEVLLSSSLLLSSLELSDTQHL